MRSLPASSLAAETKFSTGNSGRPKLELSLLLKAKAADRIASSFSFGAFGAACFILIRYSCELNKTWITAGYYLF